MAADTLTFGSYYFSSSATTTLSAATPAKAAGTTTSVSLSGFTHSANRLTYTGATTRTFRVTASLSASTISGAETLEFYLYKGGTVIAHSQIQRKVSNNDVGAVALQATVSLANTNYIELWVESLGGDDVVINYGQLVVEVLG